MTELRSLKLPADLCVAAENRFGHKFGSLEQILQYVLAELVRDEAEKTDAAEQRILEQRLRDLGYL